MSKAPCKNCEGRCIGCHSFCVSYNSWRKEYDKQREAIQAVKQIESMHTGFVIEQNIKRKKQHNSRV